MWYVRFGGEEFGPFAKSELDEFIVQLGTVDAVEVREAEEANWSPVQSSVPLDFGLPADLETQDDDKTLMSSDMSPELLAEFRSLLDEDSGPLITEGAMPRFSPPKTKHDGPPEGVIKQKSDPPEIPEVSLDELLTQSSDASESMPKQPIAQPVSTKKPMLIASPVTRGLPPNRQETAVSQTPDMRSPHSVPKKRHPKGSATPPALPPSSPGMPKSNSPRSPISAPESAKATAKLDAEPNSILLPPRSSQTQEHKPAEASAKPKSPMSVQSPALETLQQPAPTSFRIEQSNRARTVKIAIIVTTLVGGMGTFGIWWKKNSGSSHVVQAAIQTAPVSKQANDLQPKLATPSATTQTSAKAERETPTAQGTPDDVAPKPKELNTSGKAEVARSSGAAAAIPKSKPEAKATPDTPAVLPKTAPKSEPKPIAKPATKKASTKKSSKKTLSKKWVRKKSAPVLARLNRAAIEAVMQKQRPKLRNCEGTKGIKVTVSLEILSSGVVRKSQIYDRGRLGNVTKQCLASTLKRAVFPKTRTPVAEIKIPLKL